MSNEVALVFHMNLDHANLTRSQANSLLDTDLETMLMSIRIPINISSTGRDWELLEKVNPRLLDQIRDNENITILRGPYTHAILNHFPNYIGAQLLLGDITHRRIFGDSLSPYGFVPEFAFDSSTLSQLVEYWKGHIASGPASHFMRVSSENDSDIRPNRSNTKERGIVKVLDSRGNEVILNIADRDNVSVRFNKYFRGLNEPKHVSASLKRMAERSDAPFITYVQDFETPLINKAIYDGRKWPRIDMWTQLMEHLPNSGIHFVRLDDESLEKSQHYGLNSREAYVMLPRDKDKWIKSTQSYDLFLKINSLEGRVNKGEEYQQKALLQAMSSDAFVVLGENGYKRLELKGRIFDPEKKKWVYVSSCFNEYDPLRYLETVHILDCIDMGIPLNQGIERFPVAMQSYFNILHKIFSKGK